MKRAQVIKNLVEIFKRYKRMISFVVTLDIILTLFSFIPAKIIADIIKFKDETNVLDYSALYSLGIIYLLHIILSTIHYVYSNKSELEIKEFELKKYLREVFQRKNYNLSKSYGDLIMGYELAESAANSIAQIIFSFLSLLATLIISVYWIYKYDPTNIFIGISISAIISNLLLTSLTYKKIVKRNMYETSVEKKRNNLVSQASLAMPFLNSLKIDSFVKTIISSIEKRSLKESYKTLVLENKVSLGYFFINSSLLLFTILGLLYQKESNNLENGSAFAIFYIMSITIMKSESFLELPTQLVELSQNLKLKYKIIPEMSEEVEIGDKLVDVEVDNIKFIKYEANFENNSNVFCIDELQLVPGQRIYLDGINGAGKSTILKMIANLIPLSSGELRINNKSERNIEKWSIENIIYLSLSDQLFKGGVEENVCFFSEEPMDLFRAREILSSLYFYDSLNSKDMDFKIKLGPFGEGLSRGQSQKVILARALFRPPKILILDEITSGIDVDSEQNILEQLKRDYPEMIIIYVGHRNNEYLSTFKRVEVSEGMVMS